MAAPVAIRRIAGVFSCASVRTHSPMRESRPSSFLGEGSTMKDDYTSVRRLVSSGERFLGHTAAIVLGLVFLFSGLAMGVTLVLLPLGIPMGLGGLLLCLWGSFAAPPAGPV